jgi:hypothetical protein
VRSFFLGLLLALTSYAAEPLEVVQATISQSDGGAPMPPGFEHAPGEIIFLTFQVNGFAKNAEEKVHLRYTVDALDPKGVRIVETISDQVAAELTSHDKEWKPKIRTEIAIPPEAGTGEYKIVIGIRDEMAKKQAEKSIAFRVRGHPVEPSDALTIRNFRFFRGEDDQQALPKAVYRPGDPVWARFDITGYKYGKDNAVDVVYGIAVSAAGGKTMWSQPEAAVERTQAFYPKRYVPGSMSIQLQPNIRPGEYVITVHVKDATGGQTFEGKYNFTVEQ